MFRSIFHANLLVLYEMVIILTHELAVFMLSLSFVAHCFSLSLLRKIKLCLHERTFDHVDLNVICCIK